MLLQDIHHFLLVLSAVELCLGFVCSTRQVCLMCVLTMQKHAAAGKHVLTVCSADLYYLSLAGQLRTDLLQNN